MSRAVLNFGIELEVHLPEDSPWPNDLSLTGLAQALADHIVPPDPERYVVFWYKDQEWELWSAAHKSVGINRSAFKNGTP